ncbi:MAG: HNH endonuclease signature motif containing protein [Desulfobulbia bacterium]
MISDTMFPVPHDIVELERVTHLIAKMPIFSEKLRDLEKEIDNFTKKAAALSSNSDQLGIEHIIYRALFSVLEERPFQAPTEEELRRLAGEWHLGVIRRRNIPCEICGENRTTDNCHILPNHMGGPASIKNLLVLCPTHHRLFDRHMLSRSEYAQIDWSAKSEPAQAYAETVILEAHQSFWVQIDSGIYESLGQYHEAASSYPFVKFATEQILNIFSDARPLKRNVVYKLVAPELREIAKKTVAVLVKHGCLIEKKVGTVSYLSRNKDCKVVDEHIFRRVWQEFS